MRYFYLHLVLLLVLLSLVSNAQYNPTHLDTALTYVGVTEATGNNDGPEITKFLNSVGLNSGYAWCAAFVSYNLNVSEGIENPKIRSARARDFKVKQRIDAERVLMGIDTIHPGYIVGWEKGNTVFGHLGFVTHKWVGKYGKTVEGNTSPGIHGSQRDGEGVYLRERGIHPASYFRITWFVPYSYEPAYKRYENILITHKSYTTMETLSIIKRKLKNLILEPIFLTFLNII